MCATPAQALPTAAELVTKVILLPEPEARRFVETLPAAVGIGVHPASRDAAEFLRAIATLDVDGEEIRVSDLRPFRTAATTSARDTPAMALLDALEPGAQRVAIDSLFAASGHTTAVLAATRMEDVTVLLGRRGGVPGQSLVVIGVAERTPVLVGVSTYHGGEPRWLLELEARRPGIITTRDIAMLMLVGDFPGSRPAYVLRPSPDPLAALDRLRARLERDVGVEEPITKLTVSFGLAGLFFGALSLLAHKPRLGGAFFRAAAMMPVGYMGALFVPDERWQVKATALVAAFVFGLTFWVPHDRRFCGWIFMLSGLGIAALTFGAAANPSGEIALTLWGNPLTSWRFFGLRNHAAAFLAGGLIAGGALLAIPWWFFFALIGGGAALLASATLGANFLGVFTFVAGGVVAGGALLAKRVRWWHLVAAAIAGVGATIAALAADRVAVSHGGRAFGSIKDGGVERVLELLRGRAELNLDLVRDIGFAAWVGLAGMVVVLAMLFVWAWRTTSASYAVRAAVAGTAVCALAALVAEDSGFYVAGIIGLFSAASWGAWRADRDAASRAVPAPASPPATA